MASSLLRRIYDLGQEMTFLLRNGDLDRYFEVLEERGTLLDEMNEYGHPSEIDPDWQEIASALQDQHEDIMTAVMDQERRMQEALTGVQRYKGAARSYHRSEERPQILNENLRV